MNQVRTIQGEFKQFYEQQSKAYLFECNSRKILDCARDVLNSTLRNNLKFDAEMCQIHKPAT